MTGREIIFVLFPVSGGTFLLWLHHSRDHPELSDAKPTVILPTVTALHVRIVLHLNIYCF